MTSQAEMELPQSSGAPGRRRLLAALAISLLCHGLVLLLAPGWQGDARRAPPLLVTMVEPWRGDDGSPGAARVAAAAPAAEAPAAVAPVVVAPAPRVVVPARKRQVARVTTQPAAIAPDVTAAARAPAPDLSGTAPATGGAAAASGGGGIAGTGSGGGRGTSDGSGSDGLRVFCARCPAPEYPSRARRQGWQGTVDVALAIGGDGAVAEARVARSSGFPALDEVALDVARQSRFAIPAGGAGLHGQLRYRFVLDATATRR